MAEIHSSSALNPYAAEFVPQYKHQQQQPFYYYLLSSSSLHSQTNHFLHYHPTLKAEPTYVPLPNLQNQHQLGASVHKNVVKAFITCTRTKNRRGSDGFGRLVKKGEHVFPRDEHRNENKLKKKNPRVGTTRDSKNVQQYKFTAFPKKKRGFPVVPVVVNGDQTSVMIKNIPSKYTRDMLVDFLDEHCKKENEREEEAVNENREEEEETILAFDFVYLPIDFQTGMNKGYAFVNFTNAKGAWKFVRTASKKKWDLFHSTKIRQVVAARLQGKEKLERHFEATSFPCESEEVLPLCFSPPRDGIIKGEQRTIGKLLKHRGN